jgi:RimJ/RimL family protein N-acetyltransferase
MDIRLELSRDFDVINRIMREPSIYPFISDDYTPAPEQCDMTTSGMQFVLVHAGEELAGLYAMQFHSAIMLEIHTCLMPSFHGEFARQAARAIIGWVFSQTPCEKMITLVPVTNRAALRYAHRSGLKQEGCITQSVKRGGVLQDQILLGITKQEAACQL